MSVYKYYFSSLRFRMHNSNGHGCVLNNKTRTQAHLNILLTCQAVYNEAEPMFPMYANFEVERCSCWSRFPPDLTPRVCGSGLRTSPASNFLQVKNLHYQGWTGSRHIQRLLLPYLFKHGMQLDQLSSNDEIFSWDIWPGSKYHHVRDSNPAKHGKGTWTQPRELEANVERHFCFFCCVRVVNGLEKRLIPMCFSRPNRVCLWPNLDEERWVLADLGMFCISLIELDYEVELSIGNEEQGEKNRLGVTCDDKITTTGQQI